MREAESSKDAQSLSNIFASLSQDISEDEAKQFWRECQEDGKLDLIFGKVQNKLQLLWKKIRDGSATNKEYLKAALFVKDVGLDNIEYLHDEETECPSKNHTFSPTSTGDPCQDLNSDVESDDDTSETKRSTTSSPIPIDTIRYRVHSCGQSCLSDVNPYYDKNNNPLKFPVLCRFQRRHGKSDCFFRSQDVIYKTPCGKSLRNFEEVFSYLFQTQCHFLFLDYFSFNTYVLLDRKLCVDKALVEDFDISKDAESVAVSFSNEIDDTRPVCFKYRKSPWPHGYSITHFTDIFADCCDCTDGCLDIKKCSCLRRTARAYSENAESPARVVKTGYNHKRLRSPVPTGLYECNLTCKCDPKMCQNRVVQHGIQVRLQVFKTKHKGWGVRCLDDIDSGTFVCTFAGRIFVRSPDANSSNMAKDDSASYNNAGNYPAVRTSVIVNQKRRVSRSDSEIVLMHSSTCTSPTRTALHKSESKPVKEKTSTGRHLSCFSIKRPKTRTSYLQKRRRQLTEEGSCVLQHSSDDENSGFPAIPKKTAVHTGCVSQDSEAKAAPCPSGGAVKKSDERAEGFSSRDCNTSELSGVFVLETSSCQDETESSESPGFGPASKGIIHDDNDYYLDATKEGNVGRFLNHSCSPNLFVQHVFVETHCKKFPWVAFFTNRHVKAGDELTWEYNYHIGTFPDKEIPCMCGQRTCKNITI